MNKHLEGILKDLQSQVNKGFGNGQVQNALNSVVKLNDSLKAYHENNNRRIEVKIIVRGLFGKKSYSTFWTVDRINAFDEINVFEDTIEIFENGNRMLIEKNKEFIDIINGTA